MSSRINTRIVNQNDITSRERTKFEVSQLLTDRLELQKENRALLIENTQLKRDLDVERLLHKQQSGCAKSMRQTIEKLIEEIEELRNKVPQSNLESISDKDFEDIHTYENDDDTGEGERLLGLILDPNTKLRVPKFD